MAFNSATEKANLKTLIGAKMSAIGLPTVTEGQDQLDAMAEAYAEWVLGLLATLQATGTGTGTAVITGGSSAGSWPVTVTNTIAPGGIT